MVLSGLLFINDIDVYERYGAFLSEENEGDYSNYSELLKMPKIKPITGVSYIEEHGTNYPDYIQLSCEERTVELRFTIEGDNDSDFISKHNNFLTMLVSGWLRLRVPELKKEYRLLYEDNTEWQQLTPLDGKVYATFRVKFREPKPII